jgi:hypothetical protein
MHRRDFGFVGRALAQIMTHRTIEAVASDLKAILQDQRRRSEIRHAEMLNIHYQRHIKPHNAQTVSWTPRVSTRMTPIRCPMTAQSCVLLCMPKDKLIRIHGHAKRVIA